MMLAYRLVRLIETHAHRLSSEVLDKLQHDPHTKEYSRVPASEFKQAVLEMYQHLGQWLLGKTEGDIEQRYRSIAQKRAAQGVSLSELIYAITLTKEHVIGFLKDETVAEKPIAVFGELEVLYLLNQFFDRATYYAAIGYESYKAQSASAR